MLSTSSANVIDGVTALMNFFMNVDFIYSTFDLLQSVGGT